MADCEIAVSVVRTTRKTLRLSESEVLKILRLWAEREHSMSGAVVALDVGNDGWLRGAEITTTCIEANPDD
jgi:hypothetical protein